MPDTYTETTHRSWFTRIKSAISGIFIGFLLVVAATAALFWNEGRAVKTATALTEGAGQVVTMDPASPTAGLNGKLVHFSGALTPNGIPADTEFVGLKAPEGTTRLIRNVEMYQWSEDKKSTKKTKLGGGEETVTTYTYKKIWSKKPIDSNSFKKPEGHSNPSMPLESKTFGVEDGTVGALKIRGSDFENLGTKTAIELQGPEIAILRQHFNFDRNIEKSGTSIKLSKLSGFETIGDLRVSFESADVDTISGVGKLDNGEILPFETSNGRKIALFQSGEVPANKMFDDAQSGNTVMTWGIRVASFLAMLAGFKMMFSVAGVLGDVVPFVGDVFRFATGLAAFALTAILSTLVIGFAWLYFRPVLGMIIIAIGLVLAIGALVMGKAKARKLQEQQLNPA